MYLQCYSPTIIKYYDFACLFIVLLLPYRNKQRIKCKLVPVLN
jgi:hypothetical protein